MALTFANKITIARILCIPFFIATVLYYTPGRDYLRFWALGIFLFASISDVIDGFVARHLRQKTKAGAILDPLADKLLSISAFICLYKIRTLLPCFSFPLWLVVIVISRDTILLIGSTLIYILYGNLNVDVARWGKLSTFFQDLIIIGMLLQIPQSFYLWYVAVICTVISGLNYIRNGIKIINDPLGNKKG